MSPEWESMEGFFLLRRLVRQEEGWVCVWVFGEVRGWREGCEWVGMYVLTYVCVCG